MVHQPDGFGGKEPGDCGIVDGQHVVAVLRFVAVGQVGRAGENHWVLIVDVDDDEFVVNDLSSAPVNSLSNGGGTCLTKAEKGTSCPG